MVYPVIVATSTDQLHYGLISSDTGHFSTSKNRMWERKKGKSSWKFGNTSSGVIFYEIYRKLDLGHHNTQNGLQKGWSVVTLRCHSGIVS